MGSCIALLSLAALASGSAHADEPHAAAATSAAQATPGGMPPEEIEREAESIARSIMSPFCPGRTVSACPNAGPWRDDIRKWVAEGVDSLEIKRRLAERVPEHNLGGVPKNRLGWVLPVGLGIGAIGMLVFLLRYLVGPKGSGGGTAASPTRPDTGKGAAPEADGSDELATRAKGGAGAKAANGQDWDARLEEELETLD
jgi:hypothetical protein